MKKTIALLLTLLLSLSLCACGAAKAPADPELLPFSPDACAGTYSCEEAVIDGENVDAGDYTLVLSPDGDSRFLSGEDEYALQEIDWNSGLVGVEDRVYHIVDNGDGTVTLRSEDGAESYLFKLSSLLYAREEIAEEPEEEPASAGELTAGLYRCVRVEGSRGEAEGDELGDADSYFVEVREDGSVLIFLGEAHEYAERDPVTGELAPDVFLTASDDGSLELELPGVSATFAP